jgi:hypothetical protein
MKFSKLFMIGLLVCNASLLCMESEKDAEDRQEGRLARFRRLFLALEKEDQRKGLLTLKAHRKASKLHTIPIANIDPTASQLAWEKLAQFDLKWKNPATDLLRAYGVNIVYKSEEEKNFEHPILTMLFGHKYARQVGSLLERPATQESEYNVHAQQAMFLLTLPLLKQRCAAMLPEQTELLRAIKDTPVAQEIRAAKMAARQQTESQISETTKEDTSFCSEDTIQK